jgi:hypothetical protein
MLLFWIALELLVAIEHCGLIGAQSGRESNRRATRRGNPSWRCMHALAAFLFVAQGCQSSTSVCTCMCVHMCLKPGTAQGAKPHGAKKMFTLLVTPVNRDCVAELVSGDKRPLRPSPQAGSAS